MLALLVRARTVASPNRLPAKSRSSTDSGVRAAPFSPARGVPRVVLLMQFDPRRPHAHQVDRLPDEAEPPGCAAKASELAGA
jgi:hypothetical protein